MNIINVAFVGCGGIQQVHYKNLAAMDGVKMVGHCDIEKSRAEAAANQYGGGVFTEYEAMYDKVKPDAVYIAVPPYAHEGMEEAAAERDIHMFIEKPIGINRAMAKRIAAAVRDSKAICSVGYCYRYVDTIGIAREYLKGKSISLICGRWNGGMPGVWWWRRMEKSGGQIVEQTTHVFDIMRYLCGDVAEIQAIASTGCMTKVEHFTVHDSSVVSLRMKNGAAATITSSCVANHGGGVSLDIYTPEACVSFCAGTLTIKEDGKVIEYAPKVDMYEEEARVFIDAIRNGKRNRIRSSYADAMKTFMVTCAANESIESGLPAKP